MKKTQVAIAATMAVILSTVVMAMQGSSSENFIGEIASVDAAAKSLTVKDSTTGEKTMTFKVDAQTEIKQSTPVEMKSPSDPAQESQSSLSLKELKAGDRVTVSYVEQEGDHLARTIEVHSKSQT